MHSHKTSCTSTSNMTILSMFMSNELVARSSNRPGEITTSQELRRRNRPRQMPKDESVMSTSKIENRHGRARSLSRRERQARTPMAFRPQTCASISRLADTLETC